MIQFLKDIDLKKTYKQKNIKQKNIKQKNKNKTIGPMS